MSLLDTLMPTTHPEPTEARVVRLLDPIQWQETDAERKARLYAKTVKWRARNREKRNATDRAWRAKCA